MKQPLVTVGVSALDEGQNIGRLIESVLSQDPGGLYRLHRVIIVSDGSTDNTVAEVKKFSSDLITLIEHKERLGKITGLVEIFKATEGDYMVQLDADVILTDPQALSKLLAPMFENDQVWLVGGRPVKKNTGGPVDRILTVSVELQDFVKRSINTGDNIYSCHGRLVAMRSGLASMLGQELPGSKYDDAFYYLLNKRLGHKFRYVEESQCTFVMPQSIDDFRKQSARFTGTVDAMKEIFGDVVTREFSIPTGIKIRALAHVFSRHPVETLLYLLLRVYCAVRPMHDSWQPATSTKRL